MDIETNIIFKNERKDNRNCSGKIKINSGIYFPVYFMLMMLMIGQLLPPLDYKLDLLSNDKYGISFNGNSTESIVYDMDWLNQVQHNIETSEYNISYYGERSVLDNYSSYQAPNRAGNFRTYFNNIGISLVPRELGVDPWNVNLSFDNYSINGDNFVKSESIISVLDNTIEYKRNGITEWYRNDKNGLEQFFIVEEPTNETEYVTENKLVIHQSFSGNLVTKIESDIIVFQTLEGRTILKYGDLLTFDATGKKLNSTFEVERNRIKIIVDIDNAVYPITIDPLSYTPESIIDGNIDFIEFGFSIKHAGDVNGIDDVIVGVPKYDGVNKRGRVYIYHGSVAGLMSNPNIMLTGNQDFGYFGYSVSTAGDVNGDGYDDIIIGEPGFDNTTYYTYDVGRVIIYAGSVNGIQTNGQKWVINNQQDYSSFGHSVASAKDVNGDGFDDIIIGTPFYDDNNNALFNAGLVCIYYGSNSGFSSVLFYLPPTSTANYCIIGQISEQLLGFSADSAGDINGDGYGDVIIGSPGWEQYLPYSDVGRISVYYGGVNGMSSNQPSIINGINMESGSEFGYIVSSAGDVNDDGYDDIMIGAPLYDGRGFSDIGAVFLYHGSPSRLPLVSTILDADQTLQGIQNFELFGYSISELGDVNGDGYDDILIGAPLYSNGEINEGRVAIYFGHDYLGLSTNYIIEGGQDYANLGISIAGVKDINGDRANDYSISATKFDNGEIDEGRILIFHGYMDVDWAVESNQINSYFGFSVSSAGDVNADGASDVIISALLYSSLSSFLIDEGGVFSYYGSSNYPLGLQGFGQPPSATPSSADFAIIGTQNNSGLGYSVSGVGDVNGDGFDDVAVGARFFDTGIPYAGRVWIYYGSSNGLYNPNIWFDGDQSGSIFGGSISKGDFNNDGYSDVIIGSSGDSEVRVYYGSNSGLQLNYWKSIGTYSLSQYGISVDSLDINCDGFSDLVVGFPNYGIGGGIFIYYGSSSGLIHSSQYSSIPISLASTKIIGSQSFQIGRIFSNAGDVNGDNCDELLIGFPSFQNTFQNEGAVLLFYGWNNFPSPSLLISTAQWKMYGGSIGASLGSSVSSAGDVNGDGYDDIIIGASTYSTIKYLDGGAFAFYGSNLGLYMSPSQQYVDPSDSDWIAIRPRVNSGDHFGYSVSTAGDVNDDGYDDVIIGAPYYGDSQYYGDQDEGKVYVYYGSITGLT